MSFKVRIRKPVIEDCSFFTDAVRRSHSLHMDWISPKPTTPEQFNRYISRFSTDTNCGFFVSPIDSNDIVGAININSIKRGGSQSASLGYYSFLPYAGKGLMSEGLLLVIKYAFHDLMLHRIEAEIRTDNLASIALVRKCKFTYEGLMRGYLNINGRWYDYERWSILSSDC
jgi:ribosomal-protein-alanine N-acetyltransferase